MYSAAHLSEIRHPLRLNLSPGVQRSYHVEQVQFGDQHQVLLRAVELLVNEWRGVHVNTPWREWSSSNFLRSLTRNITSHSVENMAFHSLLRWKMIILPILTASLICFLFRRLGDFLNLGVKRHCHCFFWWRYITLINFQLTTLSHKPGQPTLSSTNKYQRVVEVTFKWSLSQGSNFNPDGSIFAFPLAFSSDQSQLDQRLHSRVQ